MLISPNVSSTGVGQGTSHEVASCLTVSLVGNTVSEVEAASVTSVALDALEPKSHQIQNTALENGRFNTDRNPVHAPF